MGKNKAVESWLAKYDNPMKDVVLKMREVILAADSRLEECIKWQAPTFTYKGNLASFFPKSKQHASLMFHTGAQIPGKHKLLGGDGPTGRVMKMASVAEVEKAQAQIAKIVRAWCDWRDSEEKSARPASKKIKRAG